MDTKNTQNNLSKSKKSSIPFAVSALFVLLFDQITKLLIVKNIPWTYDNPTYHFGSANPPIPVIEDFFYIVHVTNDGAAWGMLSGQTYLLTSIALIALFAMWLFRKHLGYDALWGKITLGVFAGGVVGNLIDRVFYGHVIDFLDFHLPYVNYRWPAFNVADCAICIGVFIYLISMLFEPKTDKPEKK